MKLPVKISSRKCFAIFVLAAFVLAIGIFISLALKRPEPVYEGKTVSFWLEQYRFTPYKAENISEARRAIHNIGPKAVPFIIQKLNENDSPLRNKYRDVWPRLPEFLERLLPWPKPVQFRAEDAALALLNAGTNSIPLLVPELDDSNPAVREAVMSALADSAEDSISTDEMVLICQKALADRDADVRYFAAGALERLGPVASNAIPALIESLHASETNRFKSRISVHAQAIRALERIDPVAAEKVIKENPQYSNPPSFPSRFGAGTRGF